MFIAKEHYPIFLFTSGINAAREDEEENHAAINIAFLTERSSAGFTAVSGS